MPKTVVVAAAETAAGSSPFFHDGCLTWVDSNMYLSIIPSLFILFIQYWKFNSFYSIISEWAPCISKTGFLVVFGSAGVKSNRLFACGRIWTIFRSLLFVWFCRNALKSQESVRYLIPDPVLDYIKRNKLYQVCLWKRERERERERRERERGGGGGGLTRSLGAWIKRLGSPEPWLVMTRMIWTTQNWVVSKAFRSIAKTASWLLFVVLVLALPLSQFCLYLWPILCPL